MHHFQFREGMLWAEDVPLAEIAAQVGTPAYVYSRATLNQHFQAFDNAFHGLDHLICYAVKANTSLSVMRLFADYGGGADVVSGGELYRALAAGVPAGRICFSGVGKTEAEMAQALETGILMFNLESLEELSVLNQVAGRMGRVAPVAVRVNPDVDAKTHPYISTGLKKNKFGLAPDKALEAYRLAAGLPNLEPRGIACHIGSQLTEISPFVEALRKLKAMVQGLKGEGIGLKYLDIGGGLGICYHDEDPPQPLEYATALGRELADLDLTLVLEPGRVLVGNAGVMLTKVVYVKETEVKRFVVVDAGMNDLIRPSLYGSYHHIQPLRETPVLAGPVDVVGPICESSDFLAKDRSFPQVRAGEILAVMSAGAYSFAMASSYNSRPRPAEVMVSGKDFAVIRARETYADLIRGESIPDFLMREEFPDGA